MNETTPNFGAGLRGYAICGERRAGSLFLCSLLKSTGVLGNPTEYFRAKAMRRRFPDYPNDPESQLQGIPRLAATPNGVYGLKLHALEFDIAKSTRWAERLPSLSFIHLERLDVLSQAISFVRASQTQQWVSYRATEGEPAYDREVINKVLVGILAQQNRWRYYLARNKVPLLHLTYEEMARAPQESVEAVGRLMGLTEKPRIDFSQVRHEVQRDELSEEWRQRFLAESRDLARFD